MKKILLTLLCLLTVGIVAKADDVVYELNKNTDSWMPTSSESGKYTAPDGQVFEFGSDTYFNSSYLFIKSGGYVSTSIKINCSKIILTTTGNQAANCTVNIYVGENPISTEKTLVKSAESEFEIPSSYQEAGTEYIIKNTSSKNAQITKVTFVDADKEIEYPTECSAPVFSLDEEVMEVNEVNGYAGSKVTVACDTKDSSIVWNVIKNKDENDKVTLTDEDGYRIPSDAQVGDIYTFAATASVQGEYELITNSNYLEVTIIENPTEYTFDFVNKCYELGERVSGSTSSYPAKNLEFVEPVTGLTIITADANMRLWSDGLRCYTNSYISFTAPEGCIFTNYSFTSTSASSFDTKLSDDKNVWTISYNGTSGSQAIKTVSLTWEESDPNKQNAIVSFGDASEQTFELYNNELENFEKPELTVTEGIEVVYSSSNEDVATVDATTGDITFTGQLGSATITATFAGNEEYYDASDYYIIKVSEVPVKFVKAQNFKNGARVILVADSKMATPISSELNYGYPNPTEVVALEDYIETGISNAFTLEATDGGYKIKQNDGRYWYISENYTSVNLSESPESDYAWTISYEEDGTARILNVSKEKWMQYNTSYKSFGFYDYEAGTMPTIWVLEDDVLYKPEAPEFADEHSADIKDGKLTTTSDSYALKFKKVEGVDIYYKLIMKEETESGGSEENGENGDNEDNTFDVNGDVNIALATRAEAESTEVAEVDEHEGYTKVEDEDYEKGISLTSKHSALQYYAYSNGIKGDVQTLELNLAADSGSEAGVAEIEAAEGEVRYYDLQGREVVNPAKGLYIRIAGGKAEKVLIKE